MKAYVTRDSVCAGDDGDAPHAREIALPPGANVEQIVQSVCAQYSLASISGGKASWCLASNVPLTVIAQQWRTPRMISMMPRKVAELDVSGDTIRLHFSYFEQMDPDVVHAVLRRLQLRCDA